MKKNRKGFTLVELLVVIVILGIITGLSIPLIRNLSSSMEKKKYKTYSDALLSGAKLYNDSYSEDLFGHNENGCAYVTYEQLKERNLLKDIEISDVSCDSDSTFVRILKIGDKYAYSPFLGCGKKKNGKANSIDTTLPIANQENVMKPEYCTGTEDNNIQITANPLKNTGYDKKQRKTKLVLKSGTGINPSIKISVKWSKNENDYTENFTSVNFKVPGDQKAKLLKGEIISTESKDLVTPKETGPYYLIVRVERLQDLYGSIWKNKKNVGSNYITFGPYEIDNHAPDASFEVLSTNSNYNSLKVNVKISANDAEVGKKLKYCVSKDGNNCTPNKTYNDNNSTSLKLDGDYDGKDRTVYIAVKDVAGNVKRVSKKYTVALMYIVTLDHNGATTSGSTSTKVIYNDTSLEKIKNPEKVVSIKYVNKTGAKQTGGDTSKSYTLNGWYSAASGGSKVASNSTTPALQTNVAGYTNNKSQWIKNSNATLYAQWAPVNATLPTLTKTGYTCKWTTDNGSISVNSGGTWKFTSANVRTFTAVCSPINYTITYNLNGGSVSSANKSSYNIETNSFTLTNPTRSGYTFAGWSGTGLSGSNNKTVTIIKGSTGNRSYTANWIINKPTCTITADINPNGFGWNNTNVKLTLNINGIATSKGLSTSANSTNGITSVTVSNDGEFMYYGYVSNAGGSSSCSREVKVDKTPPEVDIRCFKVTNIDALKNLTFNNGKRRLNDFTANAYYMHLISLGASNGAIPSYYDNLSGVGKHDVWYGYYGSENSNNNWENYPPNLQYWDYDIIGANGKIGVLLQNLCDRAGNCIYTSSRTRIGCP